MQAIAEGDRVADAYCNLGILQYDSDNVSAALECFTEALKNEPHHFEAHFNLGNLHLEDGNCLAARTHYEIARSIQPMHPHVHFNLGLALAISNQWAAARDTLKRYQSMASPDEARYADDLLESLELSLRGGRTA